MNIPEKYIGESMPEDVNMLGSSCIRWQMIPDVSQPLSGRRCSRLTLECSNETISDNITSLPVEADKNEVSLLFRASSLEAVHNLAYAPGVGRGRFAAGRRMSRTSITGIVGGRVVDEPTTVDGASL